MNLDPLGLLKDLDPNWLLLSLIPSAIGLVLFMYGRKQERTPHIVAGVIFMVYPIVAETVTTLIVGGVLIGLGFWYALRQDW
jgi:multisubunit Na+/H+ antiporter MnhC subunit